MKFFTSLLFIIICNLSVFAQSYESFFLDEDGYFRTTDGKNYTIVSMGELTSEQIYNKILANAYSLVEYRSNVISVPYEFVKFKVENIMLKEGSIFPIAYNATICIEYKIKDGRVKVLAPNIESVELGTSGEYCNKYDAVRKFYKKGELKKKHAKTYYYFNNLVNTVATQVLGLYENNDW